MIEVQYPSTVWLMSKLSGVQTKLSIKLDGISGIFRWKNSLSMFGGSIEKALEWIKLERNLGQSDKIIIWFRKQT